MTSEIVLHIVLQNPPPGVDFAVQQGRGSTYDTVQTQRSDGSDLHFEVTVGLQEEDLTGPFVQGPRGQRFLYIDLGTYAGQLDSKWSRRLKVPFSGMESSLLQPGSHLTTSIPGTGRDGGPSCATVKPFDGWVRV